MEKLSAQGIDLPNPLELSTFPTDVATARWLYIDALECRCTNFRRHINPLQTTTGRLPGHDSKPATLKLVCLPHHIDSVRLRISDRRCWTLFGMIKADSFSSDKSGSLDPDLLSWAKRHETPRRLAGLQLARHLVGGLIRGGHVQRLRRRSAFVAVRWNSAEIFAFSFQRRPRSNMADTNAPRRGRT